MPKVDTSDDLFDDQIADAIWEAASNGDGRITAVSLRRELTLLELQIVSKAYHDSIAAERDELASKLAEAERMWRCFHCGETFKNEAEARTHFGDRDDDGGPLCVMATVDKGLANQIQQYEAEIDSMREDRSKLDRILDVLGIANSDIEPSAYVEQICTERDQLAAKLAGGGRFGEALREIRFTLAESALASANAEIVILQATCDMWLETAARHGWTEGEPASKS